MSARYGFADFEIDFDEGTLTRRGYAVPIQDQQFRLLTLLVSRAGSVVTREEIQAHLWQENTYIEFDKSLRVIVSKLREALRDSSSQPAYIETLPRRGYRFIAPVRDLAPLVDPRAEATSIAVVLPPIPAGETKVETLTLLPGDALRKLGGERARVRTPAIRIGFAVIAVAALVLAPLYFIRARAKRVLAPAVAANPIARRSIAVIGLRNLTGSTEDAWLSTALAEMLSNELSASNRLRVVSGEEVAQAGLASAPLYTPSHQSLAQFGNKLGADTIVFGTYTISRGQGSSAPRLRLDLRVEDLTSDAAPFSLVESGWTSDLFALVSASGSQLRNRFRLEDLSADAALAVRKTLPEKSPAAELYAKGLASLRNSDPQEAKELLQEAARIEPGHAGTHLALAESWHAMGYEREARNEVALAVKLSGGLPREETLDMQGELALLSSDWPHAAEIFRSLALVYPDNTDYGLRLAQAQSGQSDSTGALVTLNAIRRPGISRADAARIDLSLARAQLSISNFREAIVAADRAIDAGTALDLKLVKGKGLWLKASSLERLGKDQESLATSAESQAIYRVAGDKQGLGIALMMSGDVLYDKGNTADARRDFEDSLRLFREIGHRRNMGIALERIGNSYFDEGKLTESNQKYKEALEAYNDVHWDEGVASITGNIANVLDTQGDIFGALQSDQQALALFERVANKRGSASTLSNMGDLELERGDLDRAEVDFNRAREINRTISYARGLAYSRVGLGNVMLAQNDISGAIRQYEQASKAIDGMEEPSVLELVKFSLGVAAFRQGKLVQSTDLLQQAKALSLKEADHGALALELAWLSRCSLQQKHNSEALAAAQQSVSESRLQFGPQRRLIASLALKRAQFAMGSTSAALAETRASQQAAKKYGYDPLELEYRILLAQTESVSDIRHRKLDELSREAAHRKWTSLAMDAGQATAGPLN